MTPYIEQMDVEQFTRVFIPVMQTVYVNGVVSPGVLDNDQSMAGHILTNHGILVYHRGGWCLTLDGVHLLRERCPSFMLAYCLKIEPTNSRSKAA